MKRGRINFRGQVTIFIIVGVLIVLAAVLAYLFFPQIRPISVIDSPVGFIENCVGEKVNEIVGKIGSQGGSLEPEKSTLYQNSEVEYLCYTGEYYLNCVVQQPMLKQHVESEIEKALIPEVNRCLSDFKETYENKGYSVDIRRTAGDILVELAPKNVVVNIRAPITLTKESTTSLEGFNIRIKNEIYDLVLIAMSITNWEARYGDSETTTYMTYYPNIKVEKILRSDGTKIYVLSNRDNPENKFQFASRSVVLPPGYGGDDILRRG